MHAADVNLNTLNAKLQVFGCAQGVLLGNCLDIFTDIPTHAVRSFTGLEEKFYRQLFAVIMHKSVSAPHPLLGFLVPTYWLLLGSMAVTV